MDYKKLKAVCFGEILFDVFPKLKKIGGAPLNVASRLKSFGVDVTMISAVGNDENGKELIEYFQKLEINTGSIQVKKNYPTGVVNVNKNSFFVDGHFPDQPVMPGVLIVEAFGQAAAALTAHGIDPKEYENKLVFLMSVEKARFRNPVIPDCKLELNIEAIRSHGRVWKYKGEAFVSGKKMADAQWSATIVDRK